MNIKPGQMPGMSRLFTDYLHNFENISPFFQFDFHDETSFRRQVEIVQKRTYPRAELGRILHRQNEKFGAGKKTFAAIDCLASNNANVIITGQQVGLFGGPLFVLYKALTAIKLAEKLGRRCQNGFVSVFWLASDDSDFAEVNHCNFLDRTGQLQRCELALQHDQKKPMAETKLSAAIEQIFATFPDYFHDTEFKNIVLEALRNAYSSQDSLSTAFARWLMFCLKEFGIVLIDPADVAIRRLVKNIYRQEIESNSASTQAVMAASERLQESGFHNQIHIRDGRFNFFYQTGGRTSLELRDGRISAGDDRVSFSHAEILAELEAHPEKFSPNVVLRALIQDSMFPTVAYVAGPAEVAYFAQLRGVYEAFQIPMPVIYPRKSATLVEPAIDRLLEKYRQTVADLWQPAGNLVTKITRASLTEEFFTTIEKLQKEIPGKLLTLESQLAAIDPTLIKMLQVSAGKISNSIENLEKKAVQAARRKETQISDQVGRMAQAIYPSNTVQERTLSFVPFLIKYGPEFIEKIYENLTISTFDHQIIRV